MTKQQEETKPVTEQQSSGATTTSTGRLATPAVRAMIKEHKLNINEIQGTGAEGRITKDDVLRHLGKATQAPVETAKKETAKVTPVEHATQRAAAPQYQTPTRAATAVDTPTSKQTKKMNDFQKGMQKSMTEALEIPHFQFKDEFDITELVSLRLSLPNLSFFCCNRLPYVIISKKAV